MGNQPLTRSAVPVLIALVLGAEERRRVHDAIRRHATVHFVVRIAELTAQLESNHPRIMGIVVDPVDQDQRSLGPTIRDLRQRLPEVPIVGYCRIGHEYSEGTLALAAAGAHELIFRGVDDMGVAFRSVLESATQASAADIVLRHLLPLVPECLHRFLSLCVRYPHKTHTVNEVADALGVSRKTLANYSSRTQMLAPGELLAWCRLCLASHYLTHSMLTVEAIALQLDFASCTALRNMMKRYTALRAQEVRARGGLPCVLEQFTEAVAVHRARKRREAIHLQPSVSQLADVRREHAGGLHPI